MDLRLAQCLQQGLPLDMDVYDLAEWCCVAELSKCSIQQGSMTVMIPDFVNRRSSVDTESIQWQWLFSSGRMGSMRFPLGVEASYLPFYLYCLALSIIKSHTYKFGIFARVDFFSLFIGIYMHILNISISKYLILRFFCLSLSSVISNAQSV